MEGAKEDLMDMFIVHTTEEIQVSATHKLHQLISPKYPLQEIHIP